jgi:flagellar motor component MotA
MPDKAKAKPAGSKPDLATIAGLVLAFVGIVGGLLLEGGAIADIAQYTAAIIVLGGTFGAVLVGMPLRVIVAALKRFAGIFREKARNHRGNHRVCDLGQEKRNRVAGAGSRPD